MKTLPISVGILSFKAPKTIDMTLTQYKDFLTHFNEAKLFFQCYSDSDGKTAQKHHVAYMGRPDNVGIQNGMRWVAENLTGEYMLYLENDFQLCVDVPKALETLEKSLKRIENGEADMIRLRSRFNPGNPFQDIVKYTKLFKPVSIHPDFKDFEKIQKTSPFLRYINPIKKHKLLARSLYIEEHPEQVFPNHIQKKDGLFIVDSSRLNWTNNPVLIRRELFLKLLDYADKHPSSRTVGGMQDFEKPLNCRWWRKQHFKIGVDEGIFTHCRIDR